MSREDEWERSGHVLQGNSRELLSFLDELTTRRLHLSDASSAERLAFNFASSAMARVDHHRRMLRDECPEFHAAYADIVAALRDSKWHPLVVALRQYVTHVGLTPVMFWRSFNEQEFRQNTVRLYREALLRCDEFRKPESLAALNSFGRDIPLRSMVTEYSRLAADQDFAIPILFHQFHVNDKLALINASDELKTFMDA
jgi:hypothetical protein